MITAEVRVLSQVRQCEVHGGQNGTGIIFFQYTTNTPYSFTQHQGYIILATDCVAKYQTKHTSHSHLDLTTGFLHSDILNKTLYAYIISHVRPISPFFSSMPQWRYSHGFCGLLAPGYWDLGFESYEKNENMSAFFPPCDCVVRDLATGWSPIRQVIP